VSRRFGYEPHPNLWAGESAEAPFRG
jgi:hypothetical protein